jgi:PHD/YefM family antitoxin component YafN of YafNO toxin-antitoxin module
MQNLSASAARDKLYRLIDETSTAHEPILISGPRSSAVLIGEEDWNAIQETLQLLSIPGMRESIREGMIEPLDQCSEEPGW